MMMADAVQGYLEGHSGPYASWANDDDWGRGLLANRFTSGNNCFNVISHISEKWLEAQLCQGPRNTKQNTTAFRAVVEAEFCRDS